MRSASGMISSSSADTRSTAAPASRWATIWRWMNSIEPTSRPRVGWAAMSSLQGRGQLARDDHLLLVAARQRADAATSIAGRADVELATSALRPVPARPRSCAGRAGRTARRRSWSSTMLSAIVYGRSPVALPVLGDVGHAELGDLRGEADW